MSKTGTLSDEYDEYTVSHDPSEFFLLTSFDRLPGSEYTSGTNYEYE
jgi:hypothetical protein